ncbi:protein LIKE COV 1-like isoform X2 [Diospyros lotus]|uniref:protein LIKE COV 1-like isoform X2 n=1 Tax=Diospyros lotus TaxID=55363 RepID=UPI00225222A2|nr:protein LIKE COV 1-like isoform X2 [Diospyros lotus]
METMNHRRAAVRDSSLESLTKSGKGSEQGRRKPKNGRYNKEEKMGTRERDRDLELLIPVADSTVNGGSKPSPPSASAASSHYHSGREAFFKVLRSWATRKFMSGCVILFPIAITCYFTWSFIHFVDFFSPIYDHLGINVFGLGFITSITFIFLVGIFMSSWLGTSLLALGEWFIKKMPLVSYIYAASKQISAAISPDQSANVFKEVAIIRHPRIGEYAFGFITSTVILRRSTGDEEFCCIYVPTNHLYLGDIYLINSNDIMKPNLSVRECIEIVISGGMSVPKVLTTEDSQVVPAARIGNFAP